MGWRSLLGESRALLRKMVLQTDDLEAQTQACVIGLGLVFAPEWLFDDRINNGTLVKITIEELEERSSAHIHLLRNAGTPTAGIKAVSEFLRHKIAKQMKTSDS